MRSIYLAAALLLFTTFAHAEFKPWVDYEASEEVYSISAIKVDANMGDVYLENLANTWVSSNEVSKELGHIVEYSIFRSELPQSGDFNLLLVVEFANTADLAPNKEKYEAFMKAFTQKRSDETSEIAQQSYPGMRTITGDYLMREIKLK
jgi:hypothetical protein